MLKATGRRQTQNPQETIHITKDAMAVGDLSAPRIIVDEGARIRGRVDMSGEPATRRPAPTRKPSTAAKTAPPSAPSVEDESEEPELPTTASTKKVAVKKRQ